MFLLNTSSFIVVIEICSSAPSLMTSSKPIDAISSVFEIKLIFDRSKLFDKSKIFVLSMDVLEIWVSVTRVASLKGSGAWVSSTASGGASNNGISK